MYNNTCIHRFFSDGEALNFVVHDVLLFTYEYILVPQEIKCHEVREACFKISRHIYQESCWFGPDAEMSNVDGPTRASCSGHDPRTASDTKMSTSS